MKMRVYLHDPENFLDGNYNYCFCLRRDADWYESQYPNRPFVCEVEVDLSRVRTDAARDVAIAQLDDAIEHERARMTKYINELEERKQRLLALPAPEDGHA